MSVPAVCPHFGIPRHQCPQCLTRHREVGAVSALNRLLGVNVWEAPSFLASIDVHFDEDGRILRAELTNRQ